MNSDADHFSRVAPAYATCRPGYPAALFEYLAGLAVEREVAWDCAAGSGQATLPLTREFRRVIATDISPAMLESAPRHARVEYRVAAAEESGLPPASVDLITVGQALHWFPIDMFFAEVHRVLKPGGVLAVWTYGNQVLRHESLDAALGRFYRNVVGRFWPTERRHVETGYRTLPFPYQELAAPLLEMEEEWTLSQVLGYIGTWSATQRYRDSLGHDPIPDLAVELGRFWGPPSAPRAVRWPLSLRVGRRPG
jgi:SAM-dependent methyltransferase